MTHRRSHVHLAPDLGARAADVVVGVLGSWRFVLFQSIVVALWILLNLYLLVRSFDPYPFILLNLLFSTQSAYASPLILMAANRQSQKDRTRDDAEAREIEEILAIHKDLYALNQRQYTILQAIESKPRWLS